MLGAEKLGGVLLNSQHNFAWLTGGKSNGINTSAENGACFLFVRSDGKRFVLANNIEMPRVLTEEISAEDFEPVEFAWQDEKSAGNFVFEKAKALLLDNREICSDLPLNPNFRSIENSIARCRFDLTEQEIKRYRKLGKDAGEVLGKIFEKIAPGEIETEIAAKTRAALGERDIQPIVTLIGADDRIEKYRHPVPTANRWRKTILIAVCAKREGLIVNLSRIACAGEIADELKRKTEAVARVFAQITAATKLGESGANLYRAAANAYAENGFADEINLHHQGGATGYKTRDWVAHPKSGDIVYMNQAFAWNPTITGTKAEETFIVTKNGVEILTISPDFPAIPVTINGIDYFSPGILSV